MLINDLPVCTKRNQAFNKEICVSFTQDSGCVQEQTTFPHDDGEVCNNYENTMDCWFSKIPWICWAHFSTIC